jgi:hypothetical protein
MTQSNNFPVGINMLLLPAAHLEPTPCDDWALATSCCRPAVGQAHPPELNLEQQVEALHQQHKE